MSDSKPSKENEARIQLHVALVALDNGDPDACVRAIYEALRAVDGEYCQHCGENERKYTVCHSCFFKLD